MVVLYCALALVALAILIIFINTLRCKKPIIEAVKTVDYTLDSERICESLSQAIKLKTITSVNNDDLDKDMFLGFHTFLEKTYPRLHQTLSKEVVNEYSLLFKWESKSASEKPMVLMAHIDVVPISSKTLDEWEHDPFSGH